MPITCTAVPLQLFADRYGNGAPRASLFNDVSVTTHPKPFGGLWTADADPDGKSSAWTEFCHQISDGDDDHGFTIQATFPVRIRDDVNVLDLNGPETVAAAASRYPRELFDGTAGIDWVGVVADFDGVHIRANALGEDAVYGVDIDSWCWFRFDVIAP